MVRTMNEEKKAVSGTKEWASHNVNVMSGCEHGCLYCYAKANAVRFKRVPDGGWVQPVVNEAALQRKYGKKKGTIMFPTTHDITPVNLDFCKIVLSRLLTVGNDVLIVSKPHLEVVKDLCKWFDEFKDQILFRFTIGSMNNEILKRWEPGAPDFNERLSALAYAHVAGFKTSVSMEPMLDVFESDIVSLVNLLAPHVTDAIWLGKANKLIHRLKFNGCGDDDEIIGLAEYLVATQSDDRIHSLYTRLKDHPKVKWKESIKKVVGIEVPTEAGLDV